MRLVSRAFPGELRAAGVLDEVREALLEERWDDAVSLWMSATGEVVDAYPDEELWTERQLDQDHAAVEIRLAPIFEDDE